MARIALIVVVLVLVGCPARAMEATSQRARYRVTLVPDHNPVPLNAWVALTLRLARTDHAPLALKHLAVDGGMPQHGHGLPTAPRIKAGASSGEFIVAGLRFNMGGVWALRVLLGDSEGLDEARFSLDLGGTPGDSSAPERAWSEAERATLRSLSIASLGPVPVDATNHVADEPRAVALGHALFFERGLSAGGKLACASCHDPARAFTDGRTTAKGTSRLERNTPSVIGAGYGRWFFADGRRDSLWSQALEPLEARLEMNATRVSVLQFIAGHARYRRAYTALFGRLPDVAALSPRTGPEGDAAARTAWSRLPGARRDAINVAFSNVGKALAAYQRRLSPGRAPFDDFVDAVLADDAGRQASLLSTEAVRGLRLFISKGAQCLQCHNGPLLTNGGFANVGTGQFAGPQLDFGRSIGVKAILTTEFTCLGAYSDDPERACPELRFLDRHEDNRLLVGAYKVPSLRNVANTGPYMHDGRFASLRQALEHYRRPPITRGLEFKPLTDIGSAQVDALSAFLETLSAPVSAIPELLRAPANGR